MAGSTLSQLLDFSAATGPLVLTGPDEIVNEAQIPSYMLSWLLSGDATDRVQGGKNIFDLIMFDAGSTANFYLPGSTRTWSNPQVLDQHQIEWRFLEDHMTFIDAEVELQAGGLDRSAKFQVFKRILRAKEKAMATRLSNKMENALFAQPDATIMEGTTAAHIQPYSIFCFVNEFGGPSGPSSSIFNTAGTNPVASGLPNGFTTIANLDPAVKEGWRAWQVPYDDPAPATSTPSPQANNLYLALSKAVEVTAADELPYKPGEATTNKMPYSDYLLPCSLKGKTLLETLARSSQLYFRLAAQDAHYGMPTFAGIPAKYCAAMNTAAVYPTSGQTAPAVGSGATEDAADKSGPRFPLISKTWMRPIFHSERYFYMRPDIVPSAQPDTTVKPVACWYNLFPRSRRKMAFVYPTSDITGV